MGTRVAVLYGGTSAEREISLESGKAVYNALLQNGYEAILIDLVKGNINMLMDFQPHIAYIAMHGKPGEDGSVQGLLELMEIPYTGSGIATSAICMDKILAKQFLVSNGIRTPEFLFFRKKDLCDLETIVSQIEDRIGFPSVIKACMQGSSIGMEIIFCKHDALEIAERISKFGDDILVEKFIEGKELTVPVIGHEKVEVLPIIELVYNKEFFDYEAKYTPGLAEHIIPARINESLSSEIIEISAQTFATLGCKGVARIDFMVDKDNIPYVIEVNTIPGMTETSLVPSSAKAQGMSFAGLINQVIKKALLGCGN